MIDLDTIKENDVVFVPFYVGDKWMPRECRFAYQDKGMGFTYVRYNYLPYQSNYYVEGNFNYSIEQIFYTREECQEYIKGHWYHGHCKGCKYDRYSAELTCLNCENKVKKDEADITKDTVYYCCEILKDSGVKVVVANSSKNKGNLICKRYKPIINNGDWIDFDWYIEVMKNCWYSGSGFCPAQNTICYAPDFEYSMKSTMVDVGVEGYTYKGKEVDSIRVPYIRMVMFDFIRGGDIYCEYVKYKKNPKSRKKDLPETEGIMGYIRLKEREMCVGGV